LLATPAAAVPFAFVTNEASHTVSVIDTGNKPPVVVSGAAVGSFPFGVAVTPDGTHVYVTNGESDTVSVIGTNPILSVTATVGVGGAPFGVAVTPDGKLADVTN
jgi:YVTN family beta-propeller protein